MSELNQSEAHILRLTFLVCVSIVLGSGVILSERIELELWTGAIFWILFLKIIVSSSVMSTFYHLAQI